MWYNTRTKIKSQPRQLNRMLRVFLSKWFEFCPHCGGKLKFIGYADKWYHCKHCDELERFEVDEVIKEQLR